MNRQLIGLLLAIMGYLPACFAVKPDSVYIFAYGTEKNSYHNGLHFAWSIDRKTWSAIGPEHSFLKCDYGRWGSQKKMYAPFLFQDQQGKWHCVWGLNETDGALGHASSDDLVYWGRQSYPLLVTGDNVLRPEVRPAASGAAGSGVAGSGASDSGAAGQGAAGSGMKVTWASGSGELFEAFTPDLKQYASPEKAQDFVSTRETVRVSGTERAGTVHLVPRSLLEGLLTARKIAEAKRVGNSERLAMSKDLFKEPVSISIGTDKQNKKPISDMLIGVFFEDINYAADGGLYAELVQNRDFEYNLSDKEGNDKSWNSYKAWSVGNSDLSFGVDSVKPIHPNNRNYARLRIKKQGTGLINQGFDGISLTEGEKYDFSVFARSSEAKRGGLKVRLIGASGEVYGVEVTSDGSNPGAAFENSGEVYGEAVTRRISRDWQKYTAVITSTKTVNGARLEVIPLQTGTVELDMISLFPQKTFKGRKNGLRADLAQSIADLKPRFVRFPGGCVAHGDGIGNIYRWENTVGPLEARKPMRNLWGYHQTTGLGYFEYFQFCEDIGAAPVPIVAAGVPCQNSAHHGCALGGQQSGIAMEHMDEYVQSVLNLIEYANGDIRSEWGSKRAAAGHPEPFGLRYLGVGNEDLITDIFEERFLLIYNAVKEKYPEITVIGTVGPFNEGTDYVEGWKLADKVEIPVVDEHYYQTPGWFLNNQDFYDMYDRSGSKVYLGEYVAHIPGRHNNMETALSEALHLINVERNADVVTMTSYAPLLAKEGHTQWSPDLIYFNNSEVKPTVGYYVQKLFGENPGSTYIPAFIQGNHDLRKVAVSMVEDGEHLIIKLVNLLPVPVTSAIDLSEWNVTAGEARMTVLKGELDDKAAKPQESTLQVSKDLKYQLPAYSLSVIKIKIL